jgi:hypothetical protein
MPPSTGRKAARADVVQWQNASFPSLRRGFDSPHPLFPPARSRARPERGDGPAPTGENADPRVPAAGRRTRRAAPARAALAATCRVGGPPGQHAPGRAALDPCTRRRDRAVNVGGPVARATVGSALQRVSRGEARPLRLLAGPAAGTGCAAAQSRGARGSSARVPRRQADALRRCRARPRRPREHAPLRSGHGHGADPMGGRAPPDGVDGAATRGRAAGGAPRARPPLSPRLRAGDAGGVREVGRDRGRRGHDGVRRAPSFARPGAEPDRRRMDPGPRRSGVPSSSGAAGSCAAPAERGRVLPPRRARPRGPRAGPRPTRGPVDLPSMARRRPRGRRVVGTWRRADRSMRVEAWRRLSPAERDAIEKEAASLPLPGAERQLTVRWDP